MPEVGGEVAFYFEPCQVEAISASLIESANLSTEQREQRIAAGIRHAHTFTWERCQRQTVELFEKVLK
jgi:alpha-1,3-rhamnosyl/mannosyltransferase